MVVVSDINSLSALAEALLQVAEDALALTDEGVPGRVYIAPASPPFDCCPFLAVHAPQLSEEATLPGGALDTGLRTRHGRLNLATLTVTIVRCGPELGPDGVPSVAELNAVAAQVQQDAWALWNGLRWAVLDGTFKDLCEVVHWDGGTSIPEQGGCVGWEFTIRAELGGMPPP